MCRYDNHYKEHWACFECRKGFKRNPSYVWPPQRLAEPRKIKCPQCGGPMRNLGLDFKLPRQRDREQWLKVQKLWLHGVIFTSCGCSGPGPRPKRLKDVEPFLREAKNQQAQLERAYKNDIRANELRISRARRRNARAKKRAMEMEMVSSR